MKRNFCLIPALAILLGANGCSSVSNSSYFQSRDNTYLASVNAPSLVVPPGLSRSKIKDYYVIANLNGQPGIGDAPPTNKVVTVAKTQQPVYVPGISKSKIIATTAVSHPALLLQLPLQQSWLVVGSGLRRQQISVLSADTHAQYYLINAKNNYQLHLQAQAETATLIFVTDQAGKPIADAINNELLTSLSDGMQGKSSHFWSKFI